jgi:aminoglycoside phosphotransferase
MVAGVELEDHPVWPRLARLLRSAPRVRSLRSGQSQVWLARGDHREVVVKIAADVAVEAERLRWLSGRLPVAEVLAVVAGEQPALVMSRLPGIDLAQPRWLAQPAEMVELLSGALRLVREVSLAAWPGGAAAGQRLVHGDACLPNFLVNRGRLSGMVDVGGAHPGDPMEDLSAALWSLNRNLGSCPEIERILLRRLGVELTPSEIEALRRRYETGARSAD